MEYTFYLHDLHMYTYAYAYVSEYTHTYKHTYIYIFSKQKGKKIHCSAFCNEIQAVK